MSQIDAILRSCRTIAVVGLSSRRFRPSYGVAEYMQRAGYRIIPVNPKESQILGEKCYPDLDSVPDAVDIVDIFRRPEFVPDIVEAAIRKGAKVIWMQEGVVHEEAARRAQEAGLVVIMDRCILKDHGVWRTRHKAISTALFSDRSGQTGGRSGGRRSSSRQTRR